jgi:CheY-like chemotaxis protein
VAESHTILAAEDEVTDAWLLRRAFERADLGDQLFVVRDGQEAIAYLSGDAPYADRMHWPLPKLLLLDLKMPRMNGFEVLAWLQTRPELKQVHAVVLSSSSNESDMRKALQLGACEFRVKPHAFAELVKTVRELHARWIDAVPPALSM